VKELAKSNNTVTVMQFAKMIYVFSGYTLSKKDREFIFEVFNTMDDKGKKVVTASGQIISSVPTTAEGSIIAGKINNTTKNMSGSKKQTTIEVNNKFI
jgi:hypothetical protein